MTNYYIKIYNDSDVLVWDGTIKEENENLAIATLLDTITLYSGDVIKIEERED